MSIAVKFYTFDKKVNSTKVPSSGGTSYNCELLDDCSILTPKIILKGNSMTSYLGSYNYAYIAEFGLRYYFITDSVYCADDGFWHITMTVDPLGSRATEIKNTNQYIERCATGYDILVADSAYPSMPQPQYWTQKYAAYFNATPATGQYIVGVASSRAAYRFGGIAYYVLTATQMNALVNYMMNVNNYAGSSITGIAAELLGMIGEPLQFIVSCKFCPRTLIDVSQMSPSTIYFGAFEAVGCQGYLIDQTFVNPAPVISDGFTISVQDHPQVVQRGNWLNGNTHTRRLLRFEPWGCIPIDSSRLIGYQKLACAIDTDIITGDAILSLYATNDDWAQISDVTNLPLLATYPTSLLIDIPLSQYRHEGYVKSAIDTFIKPTLESGLTVSKGFAGGGMMGAMAAAGEGVANNLFSIEDGTRSFFHNPGSSGTPGSLLCRVPVILSSMFLTLVGEDLGDIGRPCCQSRSINNMMGYTKCKGAVFSSDLTKAENEKIVAYMNSGFYVE